MKTEFEVPSETVSIRIEPSIFGKSRLLVSTDSSKCHVWNPRFRRVPRLGLIFGGSRILNFKKRLLIRANLIVFSAFCAALLAYRDPSGLFAHLLPVATVMALLGAADTCRNLSKRWSWHHAGVLLMIYADLLAITLLAFMSIAGLYVGH